jgi:hypothetical protein
MGDWTIYINKLKNNKIKCRISKNSYLGKKWFLFVSI